MPTAAANFLAFSQVSNANELQKLQIKELKKKCQQLQKRSAELDAKVHFAVPPSRVWGMLLVG